MHYNVIQSRPAAVETMAMIFEQLSRGWLMRDFEILRFLDGAPTEEPRPDASNTRRQRPATRATGVSRALACVLNTRGCPQVFCTAPVVHPVRVHKYPWQTS
jgi:hypothetical protein